MDWIDPLLPHALHPADRGIDGAGAQVAVLEEETHVFGLERILLIDVAV
jgi:hypothetical protein